VPHAHPPSACRPRADVTEGGNRPVGDPRDVQDLIECGPTKVLRSRPPSHDGVERPRACVAVNRIKGISLTRVNNSL
jgi:hypothetical protein